MAKAEIIIGVQGVPFGKVWVGGSGRSPGGAGFCPSEGGGGVNFESSGTIFSQKCLEKGGFLAKIFAKGGGRVWGVRGGRPPLNL